jgi:hypothetical protein
MTNSLSFLDLCCCGLGGLLLLMFLLVPQSKPSMEDTALKPSINILCRFPDNLMNNNQNNIKGIKIISSNGRYYDNITFENEPIEQRVNSLDETCSVSIYKENLPGKKAQTVNINIEFDNENEMEGIEIAINLSFNNERIFSNIDPSYKYKIKTVTQLSVFSSFINDNFLNLDHYKCTVNCFLSEHSPSMSLYPLKKNSTNSWMIPQNSTATEIIDFYELPTNPVKLHEQQENYRKFLANDNTVPGTDPPHIVYFQLGKSEDKSKNQLEIQNGYFGLTKNLTTNERYSLQLVGTSTIKQPKPANGNNSKKIHTLSEWIHTLVIIEQLEQK